jgi:hypothetical protein
MTLELRCVCLRKASSSSSDSKLKLSISEIGVFDIECWVYNDADPEGAAIVSPGLLGATFRFLFVDCAGSSASAATFRFLGVFFCAGGGSSTSGSSTFRSKYAGISF